MKTKNKQSNWIRSFTILKLLLMILIIASCEEFVVIDAPNDQLTGEVVFEDKSTVNAALIHIYTQLRDEVIATGTSSGLTYLMGHYADELDLYSNTLPNVEGFHQNNLLPSNGTVLNLWNTSYSLIYATNSIIEGVQSSSSLSQEDKDQFLGEAYFIRAYVHFYLTNLFGAIPYIETTAYTDNKKVSKLTESLVYQKIESDLLKSKNLLTADYIDFNKTRPNRAVVLAFLARVYLYQEQWEKALTTADEVINTGTYSLNTDISTVFLKNSSETLWQFSPGITGANTLEAKTFIFSSGPPPNSALTIALINSFEAGDTRFNNWVGQITDGSTTWYYPFKYKLNDNSGTQEMAIVIRLAELYLIQAEANAQLGNITIAQNSLNVLRNRAGLPSITTSDKELLLEDIYQERKIEFFTEQAHRWFDLKRTEKAEGVLESLKPNWNTTDMHLPIPESELLLNPNLKPQNEGY